MGGPKSLSSIATIIRPPLRKMARTDLQVLDDVRAALAGHQPPYRRELDLPVENTSFSCGHPAFLEIVFLVFVSHFWGALHRDRAVGTRSPLPAKDDVIIVLIGASLFDHALKALPHLVETFAYLP